MLNCLYSPSFWSKNIITFFSQIYIDKIGFIEWNRFCDRLDESLDPIRNLVEEQEGTAEGNKKKHPPPGRFQEQSAKTNALESLQTVCDKLCSHPMYKPLAMEFTLYCPFHNDLVSNWHIQLTYNSTSSSSTADEPQPNNDIIDGQMHNNSTSNREQQGQMVSTQVADTAAAAAAAAAADETTTNNDSEVNGVNHNCQEDTTTINGEDAHGGEGNNEISAVPPNNASQDPTTTPTAPQEQNPAESSTKPASNNCYYPNRKSGLGVLGADYIEHCVQPNDTISGICLQYNISAVRLRQANLFSGEQESVLLAPHKLLAIPLSDGLYARVQETESEDYKLNSLRKQFPKLSKKEATAYLELSDWVLDDALASAREDLEWEKETKDDFF